MPDSLARRLLVRAAIGEPLGDLDGCYVLRSCQGVPEAAGASAEEQAELPRRKTAGAPEEVEHRLGVGAAVPIGGVHGPRPVEQEVPCSQHPVFGTNVQHLVEAAEPKDLESR